MDQWTNGCQGRLPVPPGLPSVPASWPPCSSQSFSRACLRPTGLRPTPLGSAGSGWHGSVCVGGRWFLRRCFGDLSPSSGLTNRKSDMEQTSRAEELRIPLNTACRSHTAELHERTKVPSKAPKGAATRTSAMHTPPTTAAWSRIGVDVCTARMLFLD